MTSSASRYQLCRMVLINVGTNVKTPSGRITAIDPRGGAAVLGDNGVGKTTTLRMLPLFFGHSPSQILSGNGQQGMISFVLPTDTSAIAFEYQRGGNSPQNLRLAVIRRRSDDHDVPFYRLYRCGFRQELFVSEGRFLNDEETQARANQLGIPTTQKITTTEYRAVILNVPATSRQRDRLRAYARDWSFGERALDNLDRVVAAMVKRHISFTDIVQVAIGLVQHELGHGTEGARLSFKQGRAPIDRWLSNRSACAQAFELEPRFAALEGELVAYRAAEARFCGLRTDVAFLTLTRQRLVAQLNAYQEQIKGQRAKEQQERATQHEELERAAAAATSAHRDSRFRLEDHLQQAAYFEQREASRWAQEISRLPGLKGEVLSIEGFIRIAQAQHEEAAREHQQNRHIAQKAADARLLALERSKHQPREQLSQRLQNLGEAEEGARTLQERAFRAVKDGLDSEMEALQMEQGSAHARAKHPSPSPAALQAEQEAGQKQLAHTRRLGQAQQRVADATTKQREGHLAFERQEHRLRKAQRDVGAAQEALEMAKATLQPAAWSFLAALKAAPAADWKRDLARVVNPSLLTRADLDPRLVDEGSSSLYGWELNTGVLDLPDWADDTAAQQAVDDAMLKVAAAERYAEEQKEALTVASARRSATEQEALHLTAAWEQLKAQGETIEQQVMQARAVVEQEKRTAVQDAQGGLARVRGAIDALKKRQQQSAAEHEEAVAAIRREHDRLRKEASAESDQTLQAINHEIGQEQERLRSHLQELDAQLDAHLSRRGVDVAKLAQQRDTLERLQETIRQIDDKRPLVNSWQQWIAAGGPEQAGSLKAEVAMLANAAANAAQKLSSFEHKTAQKEKAVAADLREVQKRLELAENDLRTLQLLEDEFGDYQGVGASTLDPSASVAELKVRVQEAAKKRKSLEEAIGNETSRLRQQLTAKPSAVKDLVDRTIDEAPGDNATARAAVLCSCYKQIGPQVATDVNVTLAALLTHIANFSKSIHRVEAEVGRFNQRLQDGLSEVQCFERLSDLRIDLVTNFENLGFYRKLRVLEDLHRQQATEIGRDHSTSLPAENTARALGDFVHVLGSDGSVEVNLAAHITVKGSVSDNGQRKEFKRAVELEHVSSEGLTSLVLITLMTALLNTIRGAQPVHVPWVTDEVGKFDPRNFHALMQRLKDNRIDVVTASPELGPTQQALFAHRYLFEDKGRIREYRPAPQGAPASSLPTSVETTP